MPAAKYRDKDHSDRNREYMRRRRQDPAYLAENRRKAKEWRAERPEYHRIITAARKARKYGVETTLKLEEWLAILEQHGHRCAYCLGPFESLDHIVDISRGGPNTKENVVPACLDCNMRKGHKTGWLPSIASSLWPPTDEMLDWREGLVMLR